MRRSHALMIVSGVCALVALAVGLVVFRPAFMLPAASRPGTASADMVITARGCDAPAFTLSASREPWIAVRNDAANPMAFTIPQLQRSIDLAPGQIAKLELPRYIMGDFPFFCLTKEQHDALGGDNPYVCVLQPNEIAPFALTSGTFTIAPHGRIKEITGKRPA